MIPRTVPRAAGHVHRERQEIMDIINAANAADPGVNPTLLIFGGVIALMGLAWVVMQVRDRLGGGRIKPSKRKKHKTPEDELKAVKAELTQIRAEYNEVESRYLAEGRKRKPNQGRVIHYQNMMDTLDDRGNVLDRRRETLEMTLRQQGKAVGQSGVK